MRTVHDAVVRAAPAAVFALAADVEGWPALHPAYRRCRVLAREDRGVVFEMTGRIRGWPARWTARQERFPAEGRIVFRHLAGITRGMVVEWRLQPVEGGTRVSIRHDLVMRWPLVGRAVSDWIIGPVFIEWIARGTLQSIRRAAERR